MIIVKSDWKLNPCVIISTKLSTLLQIFLSSLLANYIDQMLSNAPYVCSKHFLSYTFLCIFAAHNYLFFWKNFPPFLTSFLRCPNRFNHVGIKRISQPQDCLNIKTDLPSMHACVEWHHLQQQQSRAIGSCLLLQNEGARIAKSAAYSETNLFLLLLFHHASIF